MMHVKDGVYFEQLDDGSVRVKIMDGPTADARVLKDVILDKNAWASVIATMSFYGEEDYGFYRATNFHSGDPLDATTPVRAKPRRW